MKKISTVLIALALTACGQQSDVTDAPPSPLPEATSSASTGVADTPSSPAMVEFVWHKKGAEFSDEALSSHATYWANVAADAGWDLNIAAIHTPRFESENFDFLWVMVWPTVDARDAAWTDWAENHEAEWLDLTSATFSYSAENAYGFAPSLGRMSTTPNTSGESVVEFVFCTYKEGKGEADRLAFEGLHNEFTDAYEAEMGATSYWWTVMSPLFEPDAESGFDYMWTNFFASDEERDAIYSAYTESEHSNLEQVDASCEDPALFDSKVIFVSES